MDISTGNFKIIENETNYCKFVWKNVIFITTKANVCSSAFTIANFNVEWQVIVDFSLNSKIRIGLRRIDSRNIVIKALFTYKVKNSRENASFKDYVESTFSHKAKTCFGDYIKIPTLSSNYTSHHKEVNIDGCVVIQQCSESIMSSVVPGGTVQQLQEDFESVLRTSAFTDVTVSIGKETIKAHKVVLCARSPVFKRMFENDMKEKQSGIVEVPDVDKLTFDKFISYLYTGVFGNCTFNEVMDLYSVADKYEVISLQKTCRDTIKTYIMKSTVSLILKTADMHHDAVLKDLCVKFICDNFHEVEPTVEWACLMNNDPQLASYTLKQVSKNLRSS